jgi:hypothetical protein
MSKVFIRDKANLLWIPISAGAGAVPNKVNAVLAGAWPQPWKSICGLTDPPSGQKRKIRNLANDAWIDLDEFSVINPPYLSGSIGTREISASNPLIRVPVGAVAGDLILSFHFAQVLCTFTSGSAEILSSTANPTVSVGVSVKVHDGVATSYNVIGSVAGYKTTISAIVKNASTVFGNYRFSTPRITNGTSDRQINSIVTNKGELIVGAFGEKSQGGSPYTYSSGGLSNIFGEYAAALNYQDMLMSWVAPTVAGSTGISIYIPSNAGTTVGYGAISVAIPPP